MRKLNVLRFSSRKEVELLNELKCAGVTLTESPPEIKQLIPHGLVLDLGGVEILLEFVPEKQKTSLNDQMMVSMLTFKYQYWSWFKINQSVIHSDFHSIVQFLLEMFVDIEEGNYPANQVVNVYDVHHNTDRSVNVLFHELDLKKIRKKIG